jgi:hypothetical protein
MSTIYENACQYNKISSGVVLAAVQDGFSHAGGVFFALVFALSHVYVCYHFAPSCFLVEFGDLLSALVLQADVFGGSGDLLLLFGG